MAKKWFSLLENVKIHPTALVETESVGKNTAIWAFCHVLGGSFIGENCNIADHCFIENGVRIGNNVTIKCTNVLYEGVTIEDDVFIGPSVTFTNDKWPRSSRGQHPIQRYSDKSHWLETTTIKRGASLGASCVILPGLVVGEYAMVAAGALVTRDVAAHALVLGSPARFKSWVCRCGLPVEDFEDQVSTECCGTILKKKPDGQVYSII